MDFAFFLWYYSGSDCALMWQERFIITFSVQNYGRDCITLARLLFPL